MAQISFQVDLCVLWLAKLYFLFDGNPIGSVIMTDLISSLLPGIPTFPNFASHRHWALNHMAAAFRHWSRSGYVEGMSGHISIRDPEYPHAFWTNPLAVHFGLLKASDMVLLSDSPEDGGKVLAGNRSRPANAAGWLIHAALHRKRRDVNAACHAHTHYGKAWSAFGRRLEMINQGKLLGRCIGKGLIMLLDVCNFYGDAQAVYEQYGGVVLGEAALEGERIAEALGPKGKGALLSNHGLLTVGDTVDEAAFLFTSMEIACGVQLEVEKAGLPKKIIGDEEAEFNFRMASHPVSFCAYGWGGRS